MLHCIFVGPYWLRSELVTESLTEMAQSDYDFTDFDFTEDEIVNYRDIRLKSSASDHIRLFLFETTIPMMHLSFIYMSKEKCVSKETVINFYNVNMKGNRDSFYKQSLGDALEDFMTSGLI